MLVGTIEFVAYFHIVAGWGYLGRRSDLAAREESARRMAASLIAEEEHEGKQKALSKVSSPIKNGYP